MAVIKFKREIRIKPFFGINLSTNLSRIVRKYKKKEAENILKTILNISEKRVVELKEAESPFGEKVILLLVYKNKIRSENIIKEIPEKKDGTFDFPVFNLDFNNPIDIEEDIIMTEEYK